MRASLRLILTLTAVAALTAACNPFGSTSSRGRLPEDPRFAEFTYKTDGEIKVQERTDSFNERMPGLGASEGHVAAANFPEGRGLPSPDHHFWVTGVATVAPESIQKLSEGATGNNTLLPGIYPGLYQYVPQDCHFSTIDPTHADKTLKGDNTQVNKDFGALPVKALAASSDCHLVVITAIGLSD